MAEKKKTQREQAETAAGMWKDGKTPQEISEIMGVTKDYVLSLLTRDPEYRNRPKEFELRRERVRTYFDEGKSVKEMAAAEGISEEQIYAILKKLGLERTNKKEKPTSAVPNGWSWKWPLATNRILLATGGTPHPVPKHSKQAEKAFWEG